MDKPTVRAPTPTQIEKTLRAVRAAGIETFVAKFPDGTVIRVSDDPSQQDDDYAEELRNHFENRQ
jgi:hypothetical protein